MEFTMSFDPETLAKLAHFAREIEAPEGERFDELQQARALERKTALQNLQQQIATLDEKGRLAWESAAQQARDFEAQLYRERQAILDNPRLTAPQRSALYREHRRTYGRRTTRLRSVPR
jgi:hypothetical protein